KEAADVQAVYVHSLPAGARASEIERLEQFHYQAALALPDPDSRLAALDAVVQADRTFIPALVSLGDALVEHGRSEEAVRLWEKAFKHQPRLVFIERMLAQHDSPRAYRALSLVSKYRDQLDADSMHLLLARAALADGDLERATVQLQAVTKQD